MVVTAWRVDIAEMLRARDIADDRHVRAAMVR